MPIVTIFSSTFCGAEEIASKVAEELGCRLLSREPIEMAARKFQIPFHKLHRAMHGPGSIFNTFTREREKNVAYLQLAMGEMLKDGEIVYLGFAGHLLPGSITHVLRVGLNASHEFRLARALRSGLAETEHQASRLLAKDDAERAGWVEYLHQCSPWDKSLYDLKLPVHESSVEETAAMICSQAARDVLKPNPLSRQALDDFITASRVRVALCRRGHLDIDVACREGRTTITIRKHVLRLARLESELKEIAVTVPGVSAVKTGVGPDFYKADIYRKQSFELPGKVLLVDDEAEFVHTLSQRLQMRDFGTAVAATGEEALSLVTSDEPEVIVLDLRMPGIGGLEVLQRLKRDHPEIEVIILTGHGTERDREAAMRLGAFAYMEKPVEIEKLSEAMKAAYEKIRNARGSGGDGD